jgi:hypothetical protein
VQLTSWPSRYRNAALSNLTLTRCIERDRELPTAVSRTSLTPT